MKRSLIAVLAMVCLIFASAALAADYNGMSDQSGAGTGGSSDEGAGAGGTRASAMAVIVKADDLSGKTVMDKAGKELGEIKTIALDTSTGTAYALIDVDDKLHPVPISAIKWTDKDKYSLNIDKSRLAQAPTVSEDNLEQTLAQKNFSSQVYRFFGIAPPTGSGMQMK